MKVYQRCWYECHKLFPPVLSETSTYPYLVYFKNTKYLRFTPVCRLLNFFLFFSKILQRSLSMIKCWQALKAQTANPTSFQEQCHLLCGCITILPHGKVTAKFGSLASLKISHREEIEAQTRTNENKNSRCDDLVSLPDSS